MILFVMFCILLRPQYRQGDQVEAAGMSGTIIRIERRGLLCEGLLPVPFHTYIVQTVDGTIHQLPVWALAKK